MLVLVNLFFTPLLDIAHSITSFFSVFNMSIDNL